MVDTLTKATTASSLSLTEDRSSTHQYAQQPAPQDMQALNNGKDKK